MTFLHSQGARLPHPWLCMTAFGARFPHRLLSYNHGEGGIVEALVLLLSTFSFTSDISECGLCTRDSRGTMTTLKISVNMC